MRRVGGLALLAVLTSCRSPSDSGATSEPEFRNGPRSLTAIRVSDCEGAATSLPAAIVATLPPRTGHMSPDDHWADLAVQVPGGFAGVLSENGRPILMLTRPDEAAAAKAALGGKLGGFPIASADVRAARWDFAQLVDWFNYLWTQPGMRSVQILSADKDERANRIRLGVIDERARTRLVQELSALNLPCDLILVDIVEPTVAL